MRDFLQAEIHTLAFIQTESFVHCCTYLILMTFVLKENIAPSAVNIGFFGAVGIVLLTKSIRKFG